MKNAKTVIDLGFGDSGKGVVVDNLCQDNSLVVRFSGGQQAGHTVIRNGVKHIFSSFGAGTLKGCPTYFTEDTTFYLNSMVNEKNILKTQGINPKLILHPLAMVTTPYDIFFNRVTEKMNNHGSCGMGVAACMKRNIETPYKLYAVDFTNIKVLTEKLRNIKNFYIQKSLEQVILNEESRKQIKQILKEQEELFFENIQGEIPFEIRSFDDDLYNEYNDFVFEGSQGIMLDMSHGFFPNVTYANTTSKNAMKYCKKMGIFPEMYYVTRCYQTRHGAGYMSNESHIELINNEEEINVTNEFQKEFRIGEIDYDQLRYALNVDSLYHEGMVRNIDKHLVVTCVDQRPEFELDRKRFDDMTILLNNSPKCGNMRLW